MTPIINPWIFYWISVADVLKDIALGLCLLCFIPFVGCAICFTEGQPDNAKRLGKWGIVCALMSALLFTFVPDEKTLTKMVLAQNVTYERVEVATNTVRDVYEDIIELFEKEE